MKTLQRLSIICALLVLFSCGGKPGEITETTTRGDIRIGVDDAFKIITDDEIYVFESLYTYAKVHPTYASEGEILDLLNKDSIRLAIISRPLTKEEIQVFNNNKIFPRETKVAYDALVFITNKSNPDTTITYDELQALFTGKVKFWSELNPAGSTDSVRVIFDNPQSGNARYVRELFGIPSLPANCFAVQTNDEVLKYVENNPGSLGIIASNYISNPDDSVSQSFLNRVKVLGVSSKEDPTGLKGYRQPYQEYIADGSYPFKREVYIINRELGTRLGTGFSSFVASDKGQRIILKSGLLPAVTPVRFIDSTPQ